MAKTTRIKLNDTTKLLSEISKQISSITKQLSNVAVVLDKNVNEHIKKNLNESIRATRVEVKGLFKDIDKETSNLRKLKNSSAIGTIGADLLGNTKVGRTMSILGSMNTERIRNLENARETYAARTKTISGKRDELQKEYYSRLTKINKKEMAGDFSSDPDENKAIANARRNLVKRWKTGKDSTLDSQQLQAASNKEMAERLYSTKAYAKNAAIAVASVVIQEAVKAVKKLYEHTKQVINDTASYAISSSYTVNSSAREQMLTYGLSESQNYAFSQVKSLMGISSDEDLFWMNDNQKQKFSELMEKETEIYEKMTSNGTLEGFQEVQMDLAILKQEFYAEIVKFVSDNKELILNTMNTTITALTGLLQVASLIYKAINYTNPMYWMDKVFNGKSASSITLNTYVTSNSTDASEVAEKTTNSTLATLATYANS